MFKSKANDSDGLAGNVSVNLNFLFCYKLRLYLKNVYILKMYVFVVRRTLKSGLTGDELAAALSLSNPETVERERKS